MIFRMVCVFGGEVEEATILDFFPLHSNISIDVILAMMIVTQA